MSNNYKNDQLQDTKDTQSIDIKRLINHLINHWKWFFLIIMLGFVLSRIYLKYSIPVYEISSTLLIKEDESKVDNALKELEFFNESKNLDNEIGILQSRQLNEDVIFNANLFIEFFHQGEYRLKEIFSKKPFDVIIDTQHLQACNHKFYIKILSENEYKIFNEEIKVVQAYDYNKKTDVGSVIIPKINKTLSFGEQYVSDEGAFKIVLNEDFNTNLINHTYGFKFLNLSQQARTYSSKLRIERLTEESTILKLSIKSTLPEKAKIYLNTLCDEYISMGLDEKNQKATRTIDFIDDMLSDVTDSLNIIEDNLQGFRNKNQIMDLSFEAQEIHSQLSKLEEERSLEQIKLKYYYYLQDYLISNDSINSIIAPSAIGINDPLLNNLIAELSQLNNEKSQLLISSTKENPYYKVLLTKIENNRKLLNENVRNIVNNSALKIENINKRIAKVKVKANKLPSTERELISITREFTVNDQIYTYLLEHRAEAAIAKASNVADNKVIDSAIVNQKTFPNSKQVYFVAFLIALAIPGGFITLKFLLSNKIISKEDVLEKTDIPISGITFHSTSKNVEIIFNSPKSIFTESFRTFKSNINFFNADSNIKTLLFTSSVSGEGKTFASINTAASYALSGKKVILIDCDLRNPNINNTLNIKHKKNLGLSQIIAKDIPWQECIIKYQNNDHSFDVLSAGVIPPNPNAIIESPKMEKFMIELKHIYDIIIIDTSPVGIISDALSLINYSDKIIFVFKHKYSNKNTINILNDIASLHKKKQDFAILINDVPLKTSQAYKAHGTYYNNKNYSYYTSYNHDNEEKESFFKQINQFLSTR